MTEWEAVIEAYVKSSTISTSRDDNVHQISIIADAASKGAVTLADIIEFMGDENHRFLNSTIESYRNRATYLVANLIHKLNERSKYVINSAVLHILSVFFTRRLDDLPSVLPSIYALSSLIEFYGEDFDPKYYDFIDIADGVFKGLSVQSYAQNIRQKIFSFYDELLSSPPVISIFRSNDYGVCILDGVISAIDGEKDPRCLLLALKVVSKSVGLFSHLLDTVSLSEPSQVPLSNQSSIFPSFVIANPLNRNNVILAGKIFDSVACYFPITFIPPPDDPFGVSSEALISALEDCLCSHETILRHHVIQFMVSQLNGSDESVLLVARLHALNVLIRSVGSHSHKILKHKDDGSMDAISEILYSILASVETSPEIRQRALALITEITQSVTSTAMRENTDYSANDWTLFNEPLLRMIRKDLTDCVNGIKARCSIEIALCICGVNFICCKLVSDYLLPVLVAKASECSTALRTSLRRSYFAALKGINVLPPTDEVLSATPFEFIAKLLSVTQFATINSSSEPSSNAIHLSDSTWNQTISNHDRQTVFTLLSKLLDSEFYDLTAEDQMVEVGRSKGTEKDFRPSTDIEGVIVESVRAMKELLVSGDILKLNSGEVLRYVGFVARISVHGVKGLWQTADFVDSGHLSYKADAVSAACIALLESLAQHAHCDSLVATAISTLLPKGDAVVAYGTLWAVNDVVSTVVRSSIGLSSLSSYIPALFRIAVSAFRNIEIFESTLESLVRAASATSFVDEVRNLTLALTFLAAVISGPAVQNVEQSISGKDKAVFLLTSTSITSCDTTTIPESDTYLIITKSIRFVNSHCKRGNNITNEFMIDNILLNDLLEALFSLIRNILTALSNELQDDLALLLLRSALDSTDLHSDLFAALCCNILVALGKESNIFSCDSESFCVDGHYVIEYSARRVIQSLLAEGHSTAPRIPVFEDYSPSKLLAIVFNRVRIGDTFYQIVDACERLFDSVTVSSPRITASFLWIVKAVSMRPRIARRENNSALQDTMLSRIVDRIRKFHFPTSANLLEEEYHHQEMFVLGLGLLTAEDEKVLATSSDCISFVFWRQKLWSLLSNPLISSWRSSVEVDQAGRQSRSKSSNAFALPSGVYYALAVFSLAINLSSQILQPNFKELTEMVVYALNMKTTTTENDVSRDQVRLSERLHFSSLQMMQLIISVDSTLFAPHLNTVIPVLVHSAQFDKASTERFSAVEGLHLLAERLTYPRLHPYKKQVCKGLAVALDDKKAAVRYMAAKARNKWMVLK